MPTWRVAEQLPAELGAVDLVIIDEASQSDVTELPALLRGKKILVVGDDRQVSPTPPFVTQEKINQLRHHYPRRYAVQEPAGAGREHLRLDAGGVSRRTVDAQGAFPMRGADHTFLDAVLS